MSRESTFKVIEDLGYSLISPTNPDVMQKSSMKEKSPKCEEFMFIYNIEQNVSKNVAAKLLFHCKTEDYKSIDSIIRIGFRNEHLSEIESPDEGMQAFKWLKNVDEFLKQLGYAGKFNGQGYCNNDSQNFRYNEKTCFNEEFKRLLKNFKNAYTHTYNHMTMFKNNNLIDGKN